MGGPRSLRLEMKWTHLFNGVMQDISISFEVQLIQVPQTINWTLILGLTISYMVAEARKWEHFEKLQVACFGRPGGSPSQILLIFLHSLFSDIALVHQTDCPISPLFWGPSSDDYLMIKIPLTLAILFETIFCFCPFHSGGPLLDLKGRMIGINTAIFTQTGRNPNRFILLSWLTFTMSKCLNCPLTFPTLEIGQMQVPLPVWGLLYHLQPCTDSSRSSSNWEK